jgi:hypothetical protein
LPKFVDLKFAPPTAVTLWATESSFVQVTVCPTFAVTCFGANWMFFIVTAIAPLGAAGAPAGVVAEPPG